MVDAVDSNWMVKKSSSRAGRLMLVGTDFRDADVKESVSGHVSFLSKTDKKAPVAGQCTLSEWGQGK